MNAEPPRTVSGTCYCWCQTCGESKTLVAAGVITRDSPQDRHCGVHGDNCHKTCQASRS